MRTAFLLAPLALGLSACTVSVRSNLGLAGTGNLLADVRPDRGQGATYFVGDPVRISVTTRRAGYVTLVALQPNGNTNVLVRNAYVAAGTTVFPRAQENAVYNVAPPTGLQRVRALFTRVRPTTDVVLSGVYTNDGWNVATGAYLAPYAPADRDVQETFFYIR